ncbi:MAG: cytochrome C oxidase subunit IV family protein [Ilumatobacteraceae bacterium]|jgi:cytochrome c oxidase subunit 4|nr:cytochrome C oxidase subunit IV family protein [Ilumatobacteraceae bacterium]
MSTTDATIDTAEHEHHEHHLHAPHLAEEHGATDRQYVTIAIILAVITAAEVALSYIDVGPAFIPALLILMGIKFFMVVSFFMHLKFDSKIFSWMFYSGLFLAVGVYVATLLTFKFFDG